MMLACSPLHVQQVHVLCPTTMCQSSRGFSRSTCDGWMATHSNGGFILGARVSHGTGTPGERYMPVLQ